MQTLCGKRQTRVKAYLCSCEADGIAGALNSKMQPAERFGREKHAARRQGAVSRVNAAIGSPTHGRSCHLAEKLEDENSVGSFCSVHKLFPDRGAFPAPNLATRRLAIDKKAIVTTSSSGLAPTDRSVNTKRTAVGGVAISQLVAPIA